MQTQIDLKLHYLYECRNIWNFLAITGADTKPITGFKNNCPCCHYVAYETSSYSVYLNCNYCPLKGFAWDFECEVNNEEHWSYYEKWGTARDIYSDEEDGELITQRKHWASRMTYACNQAIEALLINSNL